MYEKLEECPACNHTKFNNFLICKDFTVSQESFALVKCCKCQLVFTNPRPTPDSIGKYYKSDDYISHTNTASNAINLAYKIVRKITLRQKYKLIEKYISRGDILDFGCGTGHFLNIFKNKGWEIAGVEPDAKARKQAAVLTKENIYSRIDEIDTNSRFEIITAWHVIEHVHELRKTLKLIYHRLVPGGYAFIALPNHNSMDAMKYKEHWAAYDVPRHLYHFSQHSFQRFAKALKFQLVDKQPMIFDSFYVSILSSRSKDESNILQAIKNGYMSNKQAEENTGEYSSIIYILTK